MHAKHPERLPSQSSLDTLFKDIHRIRIIDGFYSLGIDGLIHASGGWHRCLLEVEGADIAVVKDLLRIEAPKEERGSCGCPGEVGIELHGELGLVVTIMVIHGEGRPTCSPEAAGRVMSWRALVSRAFGRRTSATRQAPTRGTSGSSSARRARPHPW